MADKNPNALRNEWEFGDWQRALTIHVGAAYRCRICGNLVMVTRGGVGVMELKCCGELMERVQAQPEGQS